MPSLLRMPGIAANATDAILSDWQVAENVEFAAADPIATVETEKANVDIEAEAAGVILRYLVAPGTTVEVGAPIALTGTPGETVTDIDRVLRDLGVDDDGPAGAAPEAGAEQAATPTAAPRDYQGANGDRLFVTPLVRRLARDAGLDLTGVTGTGPNGRIVKRDVAGLLTATATAAPPASAASAAPAAPAAPPPVTPAPAPASGDGYTDIPHTRMRKAIASRLSASKQTAPHFYVRGSARVDALLALRKQLNDGGGVKVSVNDLIVKAAARAHTAVPEMNVVWHDDAVRRYDTVDIAVAVATDRGLLTPVVRDVGRRSITAVAADTSDLAERARTGALRQDELEGGTLSISNLGMFGTEEFAAIINPPQAAILAVGAARQEPVVVDGELAVASVLKVTLSVDHRPVDGAVAARWMREFIDILQTPLRILA